jgi:hypothetical protein
MPDATFAFELQQARDVALVARLSGGDEGALSITSPSCKGARTCTTGEENLIAYGRGLGAGSYRAIVESTKGNPVGLTRFSRPPTAPVLVPLADDCDDALVIPETGGSFSGNTRNAFPDFLAGCDAGGQSAGGAPDQLLKLSLSQPRRVIFDLQGDVGSPPSSPAFEPVLLVRSGTFCPGAELPLACYPAYRTSRAFLDLELQAGDFFIQIDGFNGSAGRWTLEVFSEPR